MATHRDPVVQGLSTADDNLSRADALVTTDALELTIVTESLNCRWVVGTEPYTSGWISEKVFARWVLKNFTDYYKYHMAPSHKHLRCYSVHGEQFLLCIDRDETLKNHVTPRTKGIKHLWLRTTHYLPARKIPERWNQ